MFSGMSYHEKDTTPVISCLFIWFGALCFMDGGYGILLALLGVVLINKNIKDYGLIFILTGIFTAIFGILNGQIFGLIISVHIFKDCTPIIPLAVDPIACLNFSLIVGLLNTLLSSLTAIWQKGFKTDASGRLFLVLTVMLYVINTLLELHKIFNVINIILLIVSSLYWIIFPEITFDKDQKIANVIWTVYNGYVGLIQDTLSHMRLFGISLSGAILASVVNEISCLFPIYTQIIFCLIGHVFVFGLSLLSLGVHTNRLIFLEFGSKCIDGGDYYYLPLKRN
jgi:V/A-type H+-transporting ATPase subunit I